MSVGRVLNGVSQALRINALGTPGFGLAQNAVSQQAGKKLRVKLN